MGRRVSPRRTAMFLSLSPPFDTMLGTDGDGQKEQPSSSDLKRRPGGRSGRGRGPWSSRAGRPAVIRRPFWRDRTSQSLKNRPPRTSLSLSPSLSVQLTNHDSSRLASSSLRLLHSLKSSGRKRKKEKSTKSRTPGGYFAVPFPLPGEFCSTSAR